MSPSSPSPVAPTESSCGNSRAEVRQRYLVALEASRADGSSPDLDSFLAALAEPERSELKVELVALTTEAFGRHAETLDEAPPPAASDTADFDLPGVAGGTLDHIGAVEHVAKQPGATLDYDPVAPGDYNYPLSALASDGVAASGAAVSRPAGPPIPKSVAGYEVLRVLGRGAMGVVYKARQRGLKRVVALKMILAGAHASDNDLIRFRVEAEAVAQLQHPGIVQLFETGEEDGQPYFSLEFVDGVSLASKIDGTPQPPREAARLVQLMAEAMDYAHLHGVVHRDLKPANVLLTSEGMPKISDFGLAKRLEEDSSHTRSGAIMGTPSYMAPEQAEGRTREAGPLADLYSLGAVLYDLLTGRPPFRGASIVDTLEQVRSHEPVPPTQLQPSVPRDLETICLKCLQKEPAKRYRGAGALAEDLRRYLAGEPIEARPVGRPERVWRWCRRNPRIAFMSAAIAGLVIVWAVTSSVLAWIANEQSKEANRQTIIANAKTEEAKQQTIIANAKTEEVKQQKLIADQKTIIAQQNETRAKETADGAVKQMVDLGGKLHNRLQSKRLAVQADADVRKVRAELIALLKQSLVTVSKRIEAAGTTTFGRVAVAQELGDLFIRLGQGTEAAATYKQGHDIVKAIADAEPDNDQARANLGIMIMRLGDIALNLEGDGQTARKHYAQARALHQEILDKPRSDHFTPAKIKRVLSHDDVRLGKAWLALGDPAAARKCFEQALSYCQEWTADEPRSIPANSYLMEARMYLGIAAAQLGDKKGVGVHFDEALRIGEALIVHDPKDISLKGDLAEVQSARADALVRQGEPEAAARNCEDALKNLQVVIASNPDDLSTLPLLALSHERLAVASRASSKWPLGDKHFKEAQQLRGQLLELESTSPSSRAAHLLALARCGKYADAAPAAAKLRPSLAGRTELLMQLARCHARCALHDTEQERPHIEAALDVLRAATSGEYRAASVLLTDPDLEPLRAEPAFKKLVAQIQAR